MMILPEFELIKPTSLAEAIQVLANNPGARPVAGGTDLLVSMKQGLFHPTHLVDLKGVSDLEQIRITGQGVSLGACLRLFELRDHPEIRNRYTALSDAAGLVASPPLQNRGTLGGNVCLDTRCLYYNQSAFWRQSLGYCLKREGNICRAAPGSKRCFATFSSDTVPALIALGATIKLAGMQEGTFTERELPLEDFFVEDGISRNVLRPWEIVESIHLPTAHGVRSGYRKYRLRASIDYPLASIAISLKISEGRLENVRVVAGAMASAPVLAVETMAALEGNRPTTELLGSAAELVTKRARPVKNQASSPAHRRHMARVLCRRLLEELTEKKD
jgi:4-hydroxybenzoyl-CoA reductase subunit beta